MPKEIPFLKKPLAITDLEMTGLDVDEHEIVEIGLVLIRQQDMVILNKFETKTAPEHIETANPESIKIAGYDKTLWQGTPSLKTALEQYLAALGEDEPIFAAWNNTFDWAFLERGFKKTGLSHPFGYRRYDLWTAAAEYLKDSSDIRKISLSNTRRYLGLDPEPMPHRAINGAMGAYEVLKKLRELAA